MRLRTFSGCVALPAAAALLVLTGCAASGSDGSPTASSTARTGNPLKLIQTAYETTTSAKTVRISLSFGLPGESGSQHFTLTVAKDFEHKILDLTMAFPGQASLEGRVFGTDAYMKNSKGMTTDPSLHLPRLTKPWAHMRLANSDQARSSTLSDLFGGSTSDPTSLLKLITSASSSVTRIGTDVVRGQQSTRYRVQIDAAKVKKLDAEEGGCDDGEAAADAAAAVEAWLDGQGRLTRLQVSEKLPTFSPSDLPSENLPSPPTDLPSGLPSDRPTAFPTSLPSAAASNDGPTVSMTLDVYDYGKDLHVTRPPADQVQDISKYVDPSKLTPTSSPCPPR